MPSLRFEDLKLELLRGGIAPIYVERTMIELNEHYVDLENAALASGLSADEAARSARALLGSEQSIAAAVLSRPELLAWSRRWPRVALYAQTAAVLGALPALPVLYCVDRRTEIARWTTAIGAAVVLVGTVLAWLNWMITLS
jgi:hypothetical protein